MGFRYVIVEVDGLIAPADAATITELELLDKSGQKISYTIMPKAYETSIPNYWDTSSSKEWGPLNLSNGDLKYASGNEGAWSSTVFMFMSNAVFSRFALDLGSAKDIETVNVWAGSPQKRIPKNIRFYGANEYTYETHLEGRSNAGLSSLCNFSFNGSELTVAKYTATVIKTKNYLWEPLSKTSDFSEHRGSMFQVKKDFSITELLLGTPQPNQWTTGEIWEVDMNNNFVSQLYKGSTLSRLDECYVPLPSRIQLTANKRYSIIFKTKDSFGLCYAVSGSAVLAVPTKSDLFVAVTEGDDRNNYAGIAPVAGKSAIGNSYKIQVGFTVAAPEKYFEMGSGTDGYYGNTMYTVANFITMKQDVQIVAMEFFTPTANIIPKAGVAKIWNSGNLLMGKGEPSPIQEKGNWTRSVFTTPIALKKDMAYYVGFSAQAVGSKPASARSVYSNDGSLLILTSGVNNALSAETDSRPSLDVTYEFAIRIYVEVNNTRFLIDSDGTIKKLSGSWTDVGVAPVTDQMFKEHGMTSVNDITAEQWKALPKNSKILAYTESNKTFKAVISRSMLYNSEDKLYHGTGIIETVAEELPVYRRNLMITAEHQECTFEYSLDNGTTWNAFQPNDVIDVSKKSGKQLKIRTTLPTDTATLTAISYAWA
ncbi:hypothetical protein [Bacillus mobilis]|uniref:hypothetical protein n=1 Tax=Bacillus mobilis TaxID=2026190 RepID=UPI003684250E